MIGEPRFSRWAVILPAYPPVQTQNWKHTWGFLKILPTGWDIGTFLRAFQDTVRKIGPFLGVDLGIRGEILSPKILAPSVDSKINVDYDFAINHDPIQSDNWAMDFVSCPDCVEPPKSWSYLTLNRVGGDIEAPRNCYCLIGARAAACVQAIVCTK